MKKWCAYHPMNFGCQRFLGEVEGPDDQDTHGICEECLEIEITKMKDGKVPILCAPFNAGDVPAPNMAMLECVNCGREVIVSPASMRYIEAQKAYPVCAICIPREVLKQARTGPAMFCYTPGVMEQRKAWRSRN